MQRLRVVLDTNVLVSGLVYPGRRSACSRDKDLLALGERFSIVTPAAFWERHGQ